MDAILPLLIAVLLAEMGGKTQLLAHQQSLISSHLRIIGILSLTSLISYGLAAAAGFYISTLIAFDARTLLFGLALLFAGLPMILQPKQPPALPENAPAISLTRHFTTAQFGDAAQFLVFAVAARLGTPVLSVIGALAGVLTACLIPMMLGRSWIRGGTLTAARRIAATLLSGFGFWVVVSALRLA
jgi:Ca2+/H+ antiporter, TMEM165/GDT1 family